MSGPETEVHSTVETGSGCSLNSPEHEEGGAFYRILVREREELEGDFVILYEKGLARNIHSEPIGEGRSRADIDAAFSGCPCHDPANAGRQLGKAGCWAIKELNEVKE
jgi:hypothetical protein